MELVGIRSQNRFQDNLKHGVNQYLSAQYDLLENVKKNIEKDNSEKIFKIINHAIGGQISAYGLIDKKTTTYSKKEIKNHISLILNSKYLGRCDISHLYKINLNINNITLPNIIYTTVLPELLINMKKYSPNESKNRNIEISIHNNEIRLSNNIKHAKELDTLRYVEGIKVNGVEKDAKGLEMCKSIIHKLGSPYKLDYYIIEKNENKSDYINFNILIHF